ncbi:MAG: M4 family metallopeptidase [Bacteroidetes bacterium]|nr:M4 family metallopeptidase [Bacteroidota bacterium]
MKKIVFINLLFMIAANAMFAREFTGPDAQKIIPGAEKIITGTQSAVPEFVQFRKESCIELAGFKMWARQSFSLSADYDFRLLNSDKDQIGITHYRYQQTYRGVPLEGTMYIVHAKNNQIISLNGTLFNKLNVSSVPAMSESAALNSALNYMGASVYRWQVKEMEEQLKRTSGNPSASWFPKGELMLAPVKGNISAQYYRLAYRFDVYAEKPLRREYVFVDASSGEIIYTKNRIQSSDVLATAITAYSGSREIITDSVSATNFRLRETGRGNGIETYNLQTGTTYVNTDFTDADNYWNNVNAQQDQYATDAHWGSEMTYDFYWNKFSRNSIDNSGFKLLNYVHYNTNYLNAFWDGTEMTYGDGSGAYNPLTPLDVIGHEISHGLTEQTSNLNYANEPGAMNEGFSDCMGNSIRHYGKQSATIDWLIGDEMGGTPFRSMSDPNAYGNPDTYQGTYWDFATQEVHQNSTVLSHWFYLLAEGGSGTNDNGDAYTVAGIGIEKAQAICFRMNTVYFVPTSQYADARTYAIQSAIDLYGACTNEVMQTANAMHAVGIGGVFTTGVTSDFSTPVILFCSAPASAIFTNLSSNAGTFTWDFGDGTALVHTNSPTHVYNSYGQFTVSLIADGGSCGIDTMIKALYVSVDSANPCIVNLPLTGTGATQTACAGQLYDNGGPSANYTDQTDVSITIAPVGAATVTLTFSSFNLESTYDFLYIYDGPTTASTLIGSYTGTALPNGGTITSTNGAITIRQTSDQALNFSGFALTWQCSIANTSPHAVFTADATTSCAGFIHFMDQSTNGPTSWHWDFGDGDTSNIQNPSHAYAANGTYTVVLTVSNVHGTDVSTQVNYITINRPSAPVSSNISICPGDAAALTATGSSVLNWYASASGGSAVGTGSPFIVSPVPNPVTYWVESDIYPATQHVLPVDNSIGGGGYFTGSNYHDLMFDVLNPVKLVSVKVYAQNSGNRTITLIQAGVTLQSLTVNIPNGQSRVTLNWDLPAGVNFELGCQGTTGLYRNNGGAVFPYILSGMVSITGTNAGNPAYYYYFYDWELQGPPCISPRTAVQINVNTPPVAAYTSSIFNDSVSFADNSVNATGWAWDFGDPTSGANNSSSLPNPSHVFYSPGTFNVCLRITDSNGCQDSICQSFLVTGLDQPGMLSNSSFGIYPNPVNDLMTIRFSNSWPAGTYHLKLIDVLGKVVFENTIRNRQLNGTVHWDVSSLAPGAYMIQVEGENQKMMKRFIRQ